MFQRSNIRMNCRNALNLLRVSVPGLRYSELEVGSNICFDILFQNVFVEGIRFSFEGATQKTYHPNYKRLDKQYGGIDVLSFV